MPGWGRVALRLVVAAPLYLLVVAGTLLFMAHKAGWPLLAGLAAPLAASCLWHAIRRSGTLQDRLSGTRIVPGS
jgi:hypothetical protein